tara:strand:- start:330 stop:1769 length:1440 start_codon:yes stop_codon:yes gene_type:complete
MVDYKAIENLGGDLQDIIKDAYDRCVQAIRSKVQNSGVRGAQGRPSGIIGIMELHGSGKKNRPGSTRSFEGMGAALVQLQELSTKTVVTNTDILVLEEIRQLLLSIMKSKAVEGEDAINPRNIKFTVVTDFKIDKKSEPPGKPIVTDRGEVYGHYKTPVVIDYIKARKKYTQENNLSYTGPDYAETKAQVKNWATPVPNKSLPPLYVALRTFESELRKVIKDIKDEPVGVGAKDIPIINIARGVNLRELGKIESLKEGFIEILSDDTIYPRIAVRRDGKKVRGSNKPVWQSDTRPSFSSKVEEFVFTIKGDADKSALDEAVPGWGTEPDDAHITQLYQQFKIKLSSIARTKRLARECFGGAQIAREINVPGRTPGVMLKSDEPRVKTFGVNIRGKGRNKMLIINQAFAHINNRPATAKELMEIMSSGVIKRTEGQPKKNPFSGTNALAQFLRRHGYSAEGMERTGMYGTPTTLWGPRKE